MTALTCIKSIYNESGIKGFYKGITASYFGISETIIHFVIYEFIKSKLRERIELNSNGSLENHNSGHILFQSMIAGASSKTCAAIIAYPHGEFRELWMNFGMKNRFIEYSRSITVLTNSFQPSSQSLTAQRWSEHV